MPDIKFLSKAALLDKTVIIDGKPTKVLGLASFRTEPRGQGIGKHSLRAMEDIARRKGYAGIFYFCFDDVKGFYLKCGHYLLGRRGDKNIMASFPAKSVEVTEEW